MKNPNILPQVVVLMGVSGSGKTTIGRRLSNKLGWDFYDADDFHPQANIDKMSRGVPLTDADRWPWLEKLHKLISEYVIKNRSVVLACSALKNSHRDLLLRNVSHAVLVYLRGDHDLIKERMQQRQDHYMRAHMLDSQFESLEEPNDALIIDIDADPEAIINAIIQSLCSKNR
jgi:gluconokinase